jgi:hypothetical protein
MTGAQGGEEQSGFPVGRPVEFDVPLAVEATDETELVWLLVELVRVPEVPPT